MKNEYRIGIDLGGSSIKAGVVRVTKHRHCEERSDAAIQFGSVFEGTGLLRYARNDEGCARNDEGCDESALIARRSIPTKRGEPAECVISDLAHLIAALPADAGLSTSDISGVGIAIPGEADIECGVAAFVPNLGWHDVPLRDELEGLCGLPVRIENDANAAAFGEYLCGAAAGAESFVMVTLGTGIGGGFICGGKIYRGWNGAAFEVGHTVIKRGTPEIRTCSCGRRGCFEQYCAAPGFVRTATEFMEMYPQSIMHEMAASEGGMNTFIPFRAQEKGDEAARLAIKSFIGDLCCGITNIINILQPEVLAIGGGLSNEGDNIIAPLRESVETGIYTKDNRRNTKIIQAQLGNEAGMIGAANLYDI
jgi:glucokinase